MRCSFFDLIGPHHRDRVLTILDAAVWAENGAAHDVKKRQTGG